MCERYVRGYPLAQIVKKQGDFGNWKATLGHRKQIGKYANLGSQYAKIWTGKENGYTTKNIRATISPDMPIDDLAKGIWAN